MEQLRSMSGEPVTYLAYLLFILLLRLSGRKLGIIKKLAVFPQLFLILFLGLAGRGRRNYQGGRFMPMFSVFEKTPLFPVRILPVCCR